MTALWTLTLRTVSYTHLDVYKRQSSVRYREDRMVENFRRSYQELEAVHRTDIMGIYGSTHIVESEYRNSDLDRKSVV